MFPINRNRRLRSSKVIRDLVSENKINLNDLIVPLFIVEGKKIKEEIKSMPNYFRMSIDIIEEEVKILYKLGLKSVLLFVKVPEKLKDNKGLEAINPNGLMQKAIKTVKNSIPEMIVITDVALDPYSIYGHDGIVKDNKILNDSTNDVLAKMALSHAKSGADIIAPSDMMDGRILKIREKLELNNFHETAIMSYSVKYASNFYGPFRDALNSKPGFGNKKTYQMDFRNRNEAFLEVENDIKEGADIIMVKPGLSYLDIIRDIREKFSLPIAVYQVSGEYSMVKAAAEKGWINENKIIIEQLTAFKRAGASMIVSYHSIDIAKSL
ncbi:MAG: porphobilinogen synthase [Flavobacteriaceae bacterium]|nr:porphobilinogen synthase [Flavobacteriaceae bacterium]